MVSKVTDAFNKQYNIRKIDFIYLRLSEHVKMSGCISSNDRICE